MENHPTYVCGALIIPDGRIALTTTLFKNDNIESVYMSLSVETYINSLDKQTGFENKIKNELKLQLNISDLSKFSKVSDTSVTRDVAMTTKRNIQLFTYKLKDMFTFKITDPNRKPIIFYSIDRIESMTQDCKLKLGGCGKTMLKHLIFLKNSKVL